MSNDIQEGALLRHMIRQYQGLVITGFWTLSVTYLAILSGIMTILPQAAPSPQLIPIPMAYAGGLVALGGTLVPGWRRWVGISAATLMFTNGHPLILLALGVGGLMVLYRDRIFGWRALPILRLDLSDRFLHTHVMGPTGSGKSSSVLMPMIAHDLAKGHAVVLIEPKGDLSQAAYRRAIECQRTIVFFDPETPDCPRYNPLSGPADVAAEGLAWALNQVSEAGHPFYATTSRVQLIYAVLAVKEALGDQADLTAVVDFLRRDGFRRDVLSQIQDERAISYFRDQMGQINARTAHEQRQGLLNRLELLLLNPSIRRVLSGPSDFDWDTVLDQGWTVIAPLSLARLGDSARMVGTLLWHAFAMATYRRQLTNSPVPAFLYLDEFHQYVTPDLSDFLALARGYRVGMVLAHQDMDQLSHALQAAILANARQRILLGGISADDADTFTRHLAPYSWPKDIRTLPRGQALSQLTRDGHLRPPTTIHLPHYALGGP